jgi:hypothetical protein
MHFPKFLAVCFAIVLSSLASPSRSEAQVEPNSEPARSTAEARGFSDIRRLSANRPPPAIASERNRVLRIGEISGAVLGAVGGGLTVHHICAVNDYGVLCPVAVVTLFATTGLVQGILTGAVVAPTVHGSKWKNVLKGIAVGTVMGGAVAKAGDAHGKQIAWAVLGYAAQGGGTAAIIAARMR